jgi:hypothetical protein
MLTRRTLLEGAALLFARHTAAPQFSELNCDVAVIGGGTGGFAAALSALRNGLRVVLTEETDWIGGQLTAQAVPPDEHPWIEQFGSTQSYRDYRSAVRAHYRRLFPLTMKAREERNLNPGNGSVSRLTHEFGVSVAVLQAMLAPYLANRQLTLLLEHAPASATTEGDRVSSIVIRDAKTETRRTITAKYFIDATELGDLLALAKVEHVTGAEAQSQTGELHAGPVALPLDNQAFTFCFAMDYREGEDHTIDKPADYGFWRDYIPHLSPAWKGPLLNWNVCDPRTLETRKAFFEPNPVSAKPGLNWWTYRRIADRSNFTPGRYPSDITVVNWPQNDFWLDDLIHAPDRRVPLQRAKQLSLSFLYWMQTDAPRPDGGMGWKGLRLRKDIAGTADGLAKAAYVRESRRINAAFTVLEEHVGTEMRSKLQGQLPEEITAERFADSVGIGCYRIDLHPSAGGRNYIDVSSLPFQIPLGALLPQRVENLLPACKNLGTTHITNGCYRLHPVEWNIGEAAGELAAFSIQRKANPRWVRAKAALLKDFQKDLLRQGFELEWPRIHPV